MFKVFTVTLSVLLLPGIASAYSYALKEAPIDRIFKDGVAAAREGNWDVSMRKAREGISLQKTHFFKSDSLLPEFERSIVKKDISKTAENFAALVFLSIKEKLYQNRRESFKNTKASRIRLTLSRQSYLNILDGNVKKQDFARSNLIRDSFDKALRSIGNPGLFGIGKRPPDQKEYDKAAQSIEKLIIKTFPGFSKY